MIITTVLSLINEEWSRKLQEAERNLCSGHGGCLKHR